MASERLTFTLEGRDQLSRVLGHAGESAQRLRASMEDAADGSGQAILTLTRDADGRLRDLEGRFVSAGDAAALMATRTDESGRRITTWAEAADRASTAGEALKKSLLTLAPAAIPMASAIVPIVSSVAAAGIGLATLGLAVKGQVTAMSEAVEAETKYSDAVKESGRTSAEAAKAQLAYAKKMADLPPATREAAAALSVFKEAYADWSDDLAADTTGPLVKGMAALGQIFPALTPTVKGSAEQLDRFVTIAAGGISSPGFDGFMAKLADWSTGALTRANDGLLRLLRSADQGKIGGGLSEFMQWAREQGPAVAATLQDVGRALLHVLDASADVGVGMLPIIQALAQLVASVPPELITTLLQLAIAIRAVTLAAAGAAAARTAIAAMGTSLVAMRVAAAAAPGPLAAAGAAITTLSRTAKLALAGTGIGILALVIGEIAAAGEEAPIDVDKMTSSLAKLGDTGKLTGTALAEFGKGFSGLSQTIGQVIDPSVMESFDNWLHDLPGGFFNAGEATERFVAQSDAIDKSLAALVSGGKADLAAAALKNMLSSMDGEKAARLRSSLDEYDDALGNAAFEAQLAAEAQGLFGAQAQETQKKLDGQKASADGLRQAIQALNDVNRAGVSSQIAFEAAIDAATDAAKENAGVWGTNARAMDLGSEKGRTAASALTDLAAKTDAAAGAARESGASWSTVNSIYDQGRQKLVASAQQMGLSETAARKLADQILKTPNKTAQLRGNADDLQAKLDAAKKKLASVPDSRKAQVKANIDQLEGQLAEARRKLDAINGKTSVTYVRTYYSSDRIASPDGHAGPGGIPKYASGTTSAAAGWALVGEEGPELVRMRGGERVFDHRTSMQMATSMGSYPALGGYVGAGLIAGLLGATGGVTAAAREMASGIEAGIRSEMEIASPSKKSKRLMGHVGDGIKRGIAAQGPKLKDPMAALMKDLTGGIVRGLLGTKAQIQATAADLNKDIWAAFSKQKTTKDSDLVRFVNREHDRLQKLASERDRLKTRLASAQDLLKSRIDEQARYRADVRSRAQDSASLSSLGLDRQQITAGTIRGGLQAKLGQLRQFNGYITRLIKRGLHKSLLRQVIAMGPEEGLPYAAALLSMSNQDFKQTNQMQKDIDRESESLGRTSAKHFYDAGVQSAKGLVEGLKSQQKAVEKEMTDIARGMERALKKALGIKSPSRVAHAIGLNFGQSVGGGARAALPSVGQAVDAVAARMSGIRPMPGRAAAGQGVGGGLGGTTIHITVQGAVDPVSTAQQIRTLLLKDKRISGGTPRGFE
ncbi:hypothetical protein [Streptomyces filamentosus]|uniref:hypothetical protein n=1 Tax=Streptomyces filamentosus TaxID=67294 RepID=UPI0037CCD849